MVQIKSFGKTHNVEDAWLLHKTGMSGGEKPRKMNSWFLQGDVKGKTVSMVISAEKAKEYKDKGYKTKTSRGSAKKSPKKSPKKTPKKEAKKSPKKSPKKTPKKSPKKTPKKEAKKSPKKAPKRKASCSSKYKECLALARYSKE